MSMDPHPFRRASLIFLQMQSLMTEIQSLRQEMDACDDTARRRHLRRECEVLQAQRDAFVATHREAIHEGQALLKASTGFPGQDLQH